MLPETYKEYIEQENRELGQQINKQLIEIAELKNKLSRRNMQIKDLKAQLQRVKELLYQAEEKLTNWEYKGQDIENR